MHTIDHFLCSVYRDIDFAHIQEHIFSIMRKMNVAVGSEQYKPDRVSSKQDAKEIKMYSTFLKASNM